MGIYRENKMKVLDVTLSTYTLPEFSVIMAMQEIKINIRNIKHKMNQQGQLTGDEQRKYNSLINDQERKLAKLREKVENMTKKESFDVKYENLAKSQRT